MNMYIYVYVYIHTYVYVYNKSNTNNDNNSNTVIIIILLLLLLYIYIYIGLYRYTHMHMCTWFYMHTYLFSLAEKYEQGRHNMYVTYRHTCVSTLVAWASCGPNGYIHIHMKTVQTNLSTDDATTGTFFRTAIPSNSVIILVAISIVIITKFPHD